MTTTATQPIPISDRLNDCQCVEWAGLDWKGYTALLRLRGDQPSPRMIYLDGRLYLVSPAYPHEQVKKRFGSFIWEIIVGLKIQCLQAGSTTFRQQPMRGGVEGDESYYLASAAQILGKKEIDLQDDPPPDLAVEVVHTHASDAAIEVYQRLGVPEVWVYDDGLRILTRRPDGSYAESATSLAFPFLKASEISDWVSRPPTVFDADWAEELRDWVRDVLAPRRRQGAGEQP